MLLLVSSCAAPLQCPETSLPFQYLTGPKCLPKGQDADDCEEAPSCSCVDDDPAVLVDHWTACVVVHGTVKYYPIYID